MGTHRTKPKDIDKVFISYFQSLFTSNSPTGIANSLVAMSPRVTSDLNSLLLSPFIMEEVDLALSRMSPLKSLGSDGFSACFYQQH